jgi:hypothetical protein
METPNKNQGQETGSSNGFGDLDALKKHPAFVKGNASKSMSRRKLLWHCQLDYSS